MPLNTIATPAFLGAPPTTDERPHLLGGDPEVFVKDKLTGRVTISCGKVGGLKGAGVPFGPKRGFGLKMLEDNVTVEFNFNAVTDAYAWSDCLSSLWNETVVHLARKGLEPIPTSVHNFAAADFTSEAAFKFGCDPDYDAYDPLDKKRIVDVTRLGNSRCCGGHIHLGYNNPSKMPASAVAILCDMFIGLPSVSYDAQGLRRSYYGLAGLYRPKPYGIEYRTMSNWWLRPESLSVSSNMARECFTIMSCIDHNIDGLMILFDKVPLRDIKLAIDTEDVKIARDVWYQCRQYASDQGLGLGHHFYPGNL